VKFKEIASRINGISCPIFGVSWTPAKADVTVARGVIDFLEDRRVLYYPSEVESPEHCVASVLDIRRHMTDLLVQGQIAGELSGHLRAMRAACRTFLDGQGFTGSEGEMNSLIETRRRKGSHMGLQDYLLNQALGELRAGFGIHLAQIAIKYGLDVDPPLDTILPSPDE
jgi:hypothetical protein